jgi:rhodanese-related sulfurtransferase
VPAPVASPKPAPAAPGPAAPGPAAPQPAARDRFPADPTRPIREISPEEAWALFQAKVPFLDARRSADYTEGHIAGAWSVSVWESTADAQITEFEAAAQPGSTTPLVLYCSGGECEDSHLLAARLSTLGYRNLLIYRAGYPDWLHHAHPTRKGVRP